MASKSKGINRLSIVSGFLFAFLCLIITVAISAGCKKSKEQLSKEVFIDLEIPSIEKNLKLIISHAYEKKKAEDMRAQLREIIIYTRGMEAWRELIQMEVDIRKQRADAEVKQKKARASFFENLLLSGAMVCLIAVAAFLGWLVVKALQAKGTL